jgi:hypothetical protein
MKTAIIGALCLAATIQGTISTPVAKGDVTYTLSASGTSVGNFSWSVSEPSLLTADTAFSSFVSTSSPSGCTITSAALTFNYLGSGSPFLETFFSPGCPSTSGPTVEVAQQFFGAGSLSAPGIYVPIGVPTPPTWTLTISQTPEPGSLILLGSGLLGLVGAVRRKMRA